MERFLMEQLVQWKNSTDRKPLILNGARQVGKTWLLKEFARQHFKNIAYVSLDNNSAARNLFNTDFDIKRIIANLELLCDTEINPDDTLIVFDEIQSEPKALTSLKYFCELAPEYAVAAAGSLLGVSATAASGYPVGKVDSLNLYPLNFREFLCAIGESRLEKLLDYLDDQSWKVFSDRFKRRLREYYLVGGMPKAVTSFMERFDISQARSVQMQILEDYQRDFAKHVPIALQAKMFEVFQSIPQHLARENKKFVFGHVRPGARARDYEEALIWLEQAGLIYRVARVSKPAHPLKAYRDSSAFKVYFLDIGLLAAHAELDINVVLEPNAAFSEFKGALIEQFICQQLISEHNILACYWSAENSRGEVDFIAQLNSDIFAIEVKAEENLRARSLQSLKQKYPDIKALRFSLSNYRKEDWMVNAPLYTVACKDLLMP